MKMKTRQEMQRKAAEQAAAMLVKARKVEAERRLFPGGGNPSGKSNNPWARGCIDYDFVSSDPNE